MLGIIEDLLKELVAMLIEFVGGFVISMASLVFCFDAEIADVFSATMTSRLLSFTYSIVVAFVTLKFLKKGFATYVLGRDGDDTTSPLEMLKGVGLAFVIMTGFPILYQYLADITLFVCEKVLSIMAANNNFGLEDVLGRLSVMSLIDVVIILVYLVFFITLYFGFIKRGAELFILRLGVPFATVGLLDSDGGVWRPYMQQFFKISFTVISQLFCIYLSMLLVGSQRYIYACCVLGLAKTMPSLLNQFLIQSTPGGGAMQKVSSAAMTVNVIRGFLK